MLLYSLPCMFGRSISYYLRTQSAAVNCCPFRGCASVFARGDTTCVSVVIVVLASITSQENVWSHEEN